jgi:hypothetical protein
LPDSLKNNLIGNKALAGGDKPPPLQANLYLKSSGGIYPRPLICMIKPEAARGFSNLDQTMNYHCLKPQELARPSSCH